MTITKVLIVFKEDGATRESQGLDEARPKTEDEH
jgi:hypothetical protein